MAEQKIANIVLLVIGIVIFILSLLPDFLGFGTPGFGYNQKIGTAVGAIIFIVGLVMILKK